jgi:hypothetical protein
MRRIAIRPLLFDRGKLIASLLGVALASTLGFVQVGLYRGFERSSSTSRTRIVAPIAGVVMTRNVNPGEIIGSDVTSPTLFRLVDPDRIEVRFEVEELLAPRLSVGLPVQFTLPGVRSTVIGQGHVTRIAPQVEKRSIGADDARIRADSLVRPAWSDFVPEPGTQALPVNYRLEARVML